MFRSVFVIVVVPVAHLMAAEFSGRWAGTVETNGSRVPIYLILNRHDGSITGTVATGSSSKQQPMENPDLRGDHLSFETHDSSNRLMLYRLTLTDGVLGGES